MAAAKPNVQQALLHIRQLLQSRRLGQAEAVARQLQTNYPRRADVNDALGTVLAAAGKLDSAETFCRRAVASEPRNPVILLNHGRVLLQMLHIAEAEQALTKALAIDPAYYLAAWTLGTFYFQINQGERALPFYRQSLRHAPPPMQAAVRNELANCLISIADFDGAEALLQDNLAPGPFRAKAIAALASIKGNTAGAHVMEMIDAELLRPGLRADERSLLLLRKGTLLDGTGEYERAFDSWTEAKRTLGIAPEMADFRANVDLRIEVFTKSLISNLANEFGHPSELPVLVVGMPRSGTTLVERIISAHPLAEGVGELQSVRLLAKALRGPNALSEIGERMKAAGQSELHRAAEEFLGIYRYFAPKAQRVVDKMPHNFQYLGEFAALFPRAQIVHCVRHPGDTFLSAFQNEMMSDHRYSYDVDAYAQYYESYLRLMQHWHEVIPGRIHTVEYEALTAEPEGVIRDLIAAVGLPWNAACQDFNIRPSTVQTFSRVQVRQSINTRSVGRWRNYQQQLKPIIEMLARQPSARA